MAVLSLTQLLGPWENTAVLATFAALHQGGFSDPLAGFLQEKLFPALQSLA